MGLTNDRLWLLLNATTMGDRLLLMMLCADHPTISLICTNVTTWSGPKAYIESGVLDVLYPKSPNETTSPGAVPPENAPPLEQVVKIKTPSVVATPESAVAVGFSGLLAVVVSLSVLFL
ncbi:hypothetical protein B0H63DRAFT_480505 [Podospora didyma]|uniref:Uncharacterized protein n=1 Tax=Podospora didyma TaxID=330526 RepID=A0AAE0N8E0_9PEZI|nr:hypothetical protein B0H63DRAFT_480505 [Podospora didyma]